MKNTILDPWEQHLIEKDRIKSERREFKERLLSQGFDPKGSSPDEFSAFIQSESVKWAAILKEMKVKIE